MSSPYFQSFLLLGMVFALLFFVYDAIRWKKLAGLISRRTKFFRCTLLVLIEGLLVMLLLGAKYFQYRSALYMLSYWSIVIAVVLAILVVSLLDFLEVLRGVRRANRELHKSVRKDDTLQ